MGDTPIDLDTTRLLPWSGPNDQPCCLSSDGHGYVWRLADRVEAEQLATGNDVLELAGAVLAEPTVSSVELRFTAVRLTECLADVLRIAESRGARVQADDEPRGQ